MLEAARGSGRRGYLPRDISRRARRYVSRGGEPYTYFTLYEMADAAVMQSEPYLHRLAHPTPWSATMRPSFRRFLRIPCRTLASRGDGIAGCLAVRVLETPQAPAAPEWERLCERIAALDGLTGAHAGAQDTTLPGPDVPAAQALAGQPTFVLLVEAQESRWLAWHRALIDSLVAGALPAGRIASSHDYHLMHLLEEGRKPAP